MITNISDHKDKKNNQFIAHLCAICGSKKLKTSIRGL